LCIIVAGITYAYLASITETSISTGSGKLDVDYNIVKNIETGSLAPSNSRTDGLNGVVTAKLGSNSVPGAFNLYITITKIDTELRIPGLKWEVDINYNGSTVDTITGNFNNANVGDKITIVDAYELTTTDTTFDVYIWLDGNLITGSVVGKEFGATISADSVSITGQF